MSLPELVNLYGRAGFDVLCVTDHVLREDDPWPAANGRTCVTAENFDAYLEEIDRECDRALSRFGLLLVPGLELTYNDLDPDRACHAVAVGLRQLVPMDAGPAAAMEMARDYGEIVLGRGRGGSIRRAGPETQPEAQTASSPVKKGPGSEKSLEQRLWEAADWETLGPLVDRVELFNGQQLFGWVANKGLPPVACADLHREDQFPGWTTLVSCEPEADALVSYLRSSRPVFLTRLKQRVPLAA